MEIMNWWYNIVAPKLVASVDQWVADYIEQSAALSKTERKLKEVESQLSIVSKANTTLADHVKLLERPTPLQEWVEGAKVHAMKTRVRELEQTIEKTGMLRDALTNEKAYTLFLEDCLFCSSPAAVFNVLPLEKRKEYFKRAQ